MTNDAAVALEYVPGKLDETAPVRVWLQIDTDGDNDERDEEFPETEHVSWFDESIGGLEVQYVRIDLHATTVAELRAEVERLQRELTLASGWSGDPQVSARTAIENANALTDIQRQRADAAERRVAELESQFNSVLECLSHFASVTAKDGDTLADKVINGITDLTSTIEKEEARGLAVREAAQSIDDSWDALMDTQPVIPVSIKKLRELRAALTKESP